MFAPRMVRGTAAALVALIAAGCAGTTAPRGMLLAAREAEQQSYGGWISIRRSEPDRRARVEGELIAVEPDSVFVLTRQGLTAVAAADVRSARLTAYHVPWGLLSLWTAVGVLSTASHGLLLLISAPVWLITGTAVASIVSYKPQMRYPARNWDRIRPFARFPQGLPDDLDRRSLRFRRR